jgi:hypothetical protein
MRIGELLVEQRKLRESDLARALEEKPPGKRLCSYLIEKGLIDFDDASRALGMQKGVAAMLTKHLAGRDPKVASLIPSELGRGSCALPIGRSSKGAVVVAVRDPAPALLAALRQAVNADIVMIIAPASRIEALVAEAYGTASSEELDIDFDVAIEAPEHRPPQPAPPRTYSRPNQPQPPLPDMSALDPESIRLSLTDLDDERVEKDPTQSGQFKLPSSLPPAQPSTAPPLSSLAARTTTMSTRNKTPSSPTRPTTLEALQLALDRAATREIATDLVLAYIATRWVAGLVLAIRERSAIGYRGHAVDAPESVTVSLGSPSTVQRAVQTRSVSVEAPSGVGQATLTHALSGPTAPAAAPVIVGGQPVAVIAVGDPLDGAQARDTAAADLARIAEALGNTYKRFMSR